MSRIVITPWDGKNREYLERCIESVRPAGIEHRIVRCGPDWETVMFGMRNDADSVAWVDADDIVYPGALELAFDTIEQTNVGLVYTDECRIDINDTFLYYSSRGEKRMWDLVSHPGCIHHLTVTKKGAITDRVLDVHSNTGAPLDWAMKVDAAINAGIHYVPILGYGWRIHPNQITAKPLTHGLMAKSIHRARSEFREWLTGIKQPC